MGTPNLPMPGQTPEPGFFAKMFLERGQAAEPQAEPQGPYGLSDDQLIKLFKDWKKESFENRWVWERGWMRNIHYVNNRHWITYVRAQNQWVDVKLAKWVPKPVANMMADGVQALRAMFASVEIGVNVRPNGEDAKHIAVATFADEYEPILREEHRMRQVMNEADFWFIVTGNVFLHTYFEQDVRHGVTEVPMETCQECGAVSTSADIAENMNRCPQCGSAAGLGFAPAVDEAGEPMVERKAKGKGVTLALSPFELAFPNEYPRFEDVPYVIRLRWRRKTYYTEHPTLKAQMADYKWSKAPSESSMQLFRSLPNHNDLGVAPFLSSSTTAASSGGEEGAPEYEVWCRPCGAYPNGLVFRVVGDANPRILHLEEEEALPGEIPYRDADGGAVFPFAHAAFEQKGGRVYGTAPLDNAIPTQNLLNQLDSFMLMIVNRTANPLWLVPKGAEVEKFTGQPGLVVKWNPLTVGGNAKPERVDGIPPAQGLFQLREQYKADIEERMGTFDLIKGTKPAGVDAFAAMQLLVERSQSRFASAFQARGELYKSWFKFALEIEREFGPETRVRATLSPAKTWTQKLFERANLQGSFEIIVEDGSQTPKTTLGRRASIEHLNQLGFLDPADPDQRYKIFQEFGQSRLAPTLDIHMQAALRKQQAFEDWAVSDEAKQQSMMMFEGKMAEYQQTLATVPPPPPTEPQVGPDGQPMPPDPAQEQAQIAAAVPPPPSITVATPLAWKPWYNAAIHMQEFNKWANSDRIIELLQTQPALEQVLVAHHQEMQAQIAMTMAAQEPVGRKPGGAGMAMANSNQEAGGVQTANSQ